MKRDDSTSVSRNFQKIDTNSFNEKQKLAYDIINHFNSQAESRSPLLLIILGEAGTGKSYFINAISYYLKKCVITATTGKAALNINGVTIHSLLKLPVRGLHQKDLSGQSLINLQENLLGVVCNCYSECTSTPGKLEKYAWHSQAYFSSLPGVDVHS